jgi:hypothetical protein
VLRKMRHADEDVRVATRPRTKGSAPRNGAPRNGDHDAL